MKERMVNHSFIILYLHYFIILTFSPLLSPITTTKVSTIPQAYLDSMILREENLKTLQSQYVDEPKENSEFRIVGSFNIELLQGNKEFENFSFQCVPYIAYINIEPDGAITPCDRMTKWKLGSLKEKPLKEILSRSEHIRRDWEDIYGKLESLGILQKCKSCKYYALCGGVCPGIAFRSHELGEEHPDPIVCRVFNEAMDIILKYSSLPVKKKILELIKG